jgi:hypothetical protein
MNLFRLPFSRPFLPLMQKLSQLLTSQKSQSIRQRGQFLFHLDQLAMKVPMQGAIKQSKVIHILKGQQKTESTTSS